MLRCFAFCFFVLTGCAPQLVVSIAKSEGDIPVRRAVFEEPPEVFTLAFREGCNGPGETYRRVSPTTDQCLLPPSPDVAAWLLLQFAAALETPTIVAQKKSTPTTDGTLIEISYFAEITAKSGTPQRIYFRDRDLDRTTDLMLRIWGGRPQ